MKIKLRVKDMSQLTNERPLFALGVVEGEVQEGHDLLGKVRPQVLVHAEVAKK